MLRNSSTKTEKPVYRPWVAALLPVWVLAGFILAQLLTGAVIALIHNFGISLTGVNEAVLNAVAGAVIYIITIGIVIGLPWWILKKRTTLEELGLNRLPMWKDIWMAPLGFVVYLLLSGILLMVSQQFLTFIDFDQVQETGFDQISQQFEYLLAFITLVILAPVAEEVVFRGYLFGKLRKVAPLWVAILITSLLFAVVHFAWNVGIDVFALSIILCLLRVWSGSLWPSILLHMMKNSVAFYFLFINPTLLTTLGG